MALSTSNTLADLYDAFPYTSLPFRTSHPDRLSVEAGLAGLITPTVTTARVLEIGCASGGNLLPMCEVMPEAHFVGIDLSPKQIDAARRDAAAAGIENVVLLAGDFGDLAADEKFDYIIAHGVYSWVSAATRDRLLQQCANLLTANGVAFISFNVNPGWRLRGIAGDLYRLGLIGSDQSDPRAAVSSVREALRAVSKAAAVVHPAWGQLLGMTADTLDSRPTDQIIHDELEPFNHAAYFGEFVAHAQRHDLAYLTTADPFLEKLTRVAPAVLRELRATTSDEMALEQLADVAVARSFRQAVLCHAGATRRTDSIASFAERCWIASDLRQVGNGAFSHRSSKRQVSGLPPALVGLLEQASAAWPGAVRLIDGLAQPAPAVIDAIKTLAEAGLVELWTRRPTFIADRSKANPRPSRLACVQAARRGPVTNLRHMAFDLDDGLRAALIACTGPSGGQEVPEQVLRTLIEQGFMTCR